MKKIRSAQVGLYLVVLTVASCGFPRLSELVDGGGGSDGATSDGWPLPLELELLAGNIGGPGSADGIGAAARFFGPDGVAVDSSGNVYIADTGNNNIRKVTPAGVVTTLAGTAGMFGSADGTGAGARFYLPTEVAVDNTGNVYIADRDNYTIRKVTAAGVATTLAGTAGMAGSADGIGPAARFSLPTGVAVDSAGNVYVADQGNSAIRKVTPAGVVTTLAGTAGINQPGGVVVDSTGNIYVADTFGHTIRQITAAGIVTTLAGTAGMAGSADGTGPAARFNLPTSVAVDTAGNVYVADSNNSTIRKVTPTGIVTTLAGTPGMPGSADGTGPAARFNQPAGVAIDGAGNVYVADQNNHSIRKIAADGVVTTLAGVASMSGSADGTGPAARFNQPNGGAVDSAGNVYANEFGNHTIRKITPDGVVTTLAGTAGMAGSADGSGPAARFNLPTSVAVDSAGNVYVADFGNHTIRKVTPDGVVTTLAGTAGIAGSADGTGPAARFNEPDVVTVDNAGNVYLGEFGNHTIRKITPEGVVTTLAGYPGISGSADGTGPAARFYNPTGVAVDSTGDIYVADQGNHTIRKITTEGVVTTLAGTAGMPGSADGTGPAAHFHNPIRLVLDSAGNVYVADLRNSTIRKVTPTGITTTVTGTAGLAGILLGATPRLASPRGLAIIGDSIVVTDTNAILLLRHGVQ